MTFDTVAELLIFSSTEICWYAPKYLEVQNGDDWTTNNPKVEIRATVRHPKVKVVGKVIAKRSDFMTVGVLWGGDECGAFGCKKPKHVDITF